MCSERYVLDGFALLNLGHVVHLFAGSVSNRYLDSARRFQCHDSIFRHVQFDGRLTQRQGWGIAFSQCGFPFGY